MKAKRTAGKSKADPVLEAAARRGATYLHALPAKERYPIELVASLAVQLVKGEDYEVAARGALQLIDACEQAIQAHEKDRNDKERALLQSLETDLSFAQAVLEITGERRRARAEEKFAAFIREFIADDDADASRWLSHFKVRGFPSDRLIEWRMGFKRWWAERTHAARVKGGKTRRLTHNKVFQSRHELNTSRHESGRKQPRAA